MRLGLGVASWLALIACGAPEKESAKKEIVWITTIPQAKENAYWRWKHWEDVAKAARGNIDLLFVGDSITGRWETVGERIWNRYYVHRRAMNIGIGGDGTEHVLWRLGHGVTDGIEPKVAIVMIGTNNLDTYLRFDVGSPGDVADGIWAVVRTLEKNLPETEILLLGLLPRDHKETLTRRTIKALNQELESRARDEERVHFLEIWDEFLESETQLLRAELMDDIALHPSEAGYRVWAEAMEPLLARLLGDESIAPETSAALPDGETAKAKQSDGETNGSGS